MSTATAPGKIILFGEHAVVYGRPAIAIPLVEVRARATVEAARQPGVRLQAPDLKLERRLSEVEAGDPFSVAVSLVQAAINLSRLPDITITVTSEIPIASGLGSGAAITAAIVRALAAFLGHEALATDEWVSAVTYEVEKIHHGTPSGIDNTVITFERPVYFVRREPQNLIETFQVARPLRLLVGDTGISSSTRVAVGDVRRQWKAEPERFERLFDGCGAIARAARRAVENGQQEEVGRLMLQNHDLLCEMTVSSPELDRLVEAATIAGALGAKLSGGGRGGNMIALVSAATEEVVRQALLGAGATNVLRTTLAPPVENPAQPEQTTSGSY